VSGWGCCNCLCVLMIAAMCLPHLMGPLVLSTWPWLVQHHRQAVSTPLRREPCGAVVVWQDGGEPGASGFYPGAFDDGGAFLFVCSMLSYSCYDCASMKECAYCASTGTCMPAATPPEGGEPRPVIGDCPAASFVYDEDT
jgi:hypothetical protein